MIQQTNTTHILETDFLNEQFNKKTNYSLANININPKLFSENIGALSSSKELVIKYDLNGKINYISSACKKMTGYHPEELLNSNIENQFYGKPIIIANSNSTKSIRNLLLNKQKGLIPVIQKTFSLITGNRSDEIITILTQINNTPKTSKRVQKTLDVIHKTIINKDTYIPICSFCHKFRDGEEALNNWFSPDPEIVKHIPENQFTHGICLDCFKYHYPKLYLKREARLKSIHFQH